MPHLPIITGCSRVALDLRSDNGQSAKCIIHVSSTDTPPNVADHLSTALQASTVANMWLPMSLHAGLFGFDLLPLDGTTAALRRDFPSNVSGQGGDEFLPAVAMVVTHRTAVRGRRARGRTYIPFIAESTVNDGHFIGDADALVAPAWNTLQGHLQALTPAINLVVASYKTPEANIITTSQQQHFCATQRRRQSRLRFG